MSASLWVQAAHMSREANNEKPPALAMLISIHFAHRNECVSVGVGGAHEQRGEQ